MKLRKYIVCLDIGDDFCNVAVPAENEAEAREYVKGNGEVIGIKDVTEKTKIYQGDVEYALKSRDFKPNEVDFMLRTLTLTGIIE